MKRVLTGIQSTGRPHLGNLLGAIIPAIRLSKDNHESLFFIADLHSFTTIRCANDLKQNTYATAAAWIAFGFDTKNNYFYRQSDLPQVTELAWYLSCFTPFPMLANAHSFKDKSDRLSQVNAGLSTYPVLMAADILLYDANIVPVGKDQKQHLEITRDLAKAFNYKYPNSFIVPEISIDKKSQIIPGIDGNKMSKSYDNTIDIFLSDKKLRKRIMQIKTDSKPVEAIKNPEICNVFNLYKFIASENQVLEMKKKYQAGNFGYGQAKEELYNLIIDKFHNERNKFQFLMNNTEIIEKELRKGAKKAQVIADEVLNRVRSKIGY